MPQSIIFGAGGRRSAPPLFFALALALLSGLCVVAGGPELCVALLLGGLGAVLITMRPAYGVGILLFSFLMTYSSWLRGIGYLTLNNVMGAWLLVVLLYRASRDGNWSFLRHPEVQILLVIGVVGLLSRYLHAPDETTRQLVGRLETRGQDPARIFVGRFAFLVFFISFIATRRHVRTLFNLTVGAMVISGLAGIWRVLGGGGFAGYRANWGLIVAAAGNPNRLALFCVIAIVALWYLLQWRKQLAVQLIVGAIILALVLAVFMTGSRSGAFGLLLAVLFLFLEGGLTVRKVLLGTVAGLIAAALIVRAAPAASLERIATLPGTAQAADPLGRGSLERRSYGAHLAIQLAKENFLIGTGMGNWEITRYLRDPAFYTTPPHSSYLAALVEGGAVTLTLYFLLFSCVLRNLLEAQWAWERVQPQSEDTMAMLWVTRTLKIGFIVLLAFSLVADLWRDIIFFWFIGLSVVLRQLAYRETMLPTAAAA